jgi:hypothetical protein
MCSLNELSGGGDKVLVVTYVDLCCRRLCCASYIFRLQGQSCDDMILSDKREATSYVIAESRHLETI